MTYASQSAQILAYLAKGYSLTHRDAQRLFNCDRLGARIYDLKKEGHNIINGQLMSLHIFSALLVNLKDWKRWRDVYRIHN